MCSAFQDVDTHADFDIRRGFIRVGGMREHGAELHAQATHLGRSLVDIAKLPKRTVRLDLVSNARVWIDVGQFAPNRERTSSKLSVHMGEKIVIAMLSGTRLTEQFGKQRRTGTRSRKTGV